MLRILILPVLFVLSMQCSAQPYKFAIGIRGDWSNFDADLAEISTNYFFMKNESIETNFGFGRRYGWIEARYLHHGILRHIHFKNDVLWYLGGGADLGYWNKNYDNYYSKQTHTGYWFGITPVLGATYTFDRIPICIAMDTGPSLRLQPRLMLGFIVGFSVRYAFRKSLQ